MALPQTPVQEGPAPVRQAPVPTEGLAPDDRAAPGQDAAPAGRTAAEEGTGTGTGTGETVPGVPAPAPPDGRWVCNLLILAFLLVMAFLVAITMDGDKRIPDLTQASSAVVTALLGGVINPGSVPRPVWGALAVLSLAVAVLAGAVVFTLPSHTNAVAAVTAAIAAFVGLLSDTSRWTHLDRLGPRG